MDVSTVLGVLRRRWLVLLLLLVAAGGATGWVYDNVPVVYQSQATMIVLLPNENSDGQGATYPVNPYLNVGAASSQVAASALANVSTSQEFRSALESDGVTSTTSVEVAAYGGGVVLVLTATNDVADAAAPDLAVVSSQIATELQDRQEAAGAPAGTLLTATDLTAPSPATVLAGDRTKLAVVTAAIGLLVTLAVVLVAETAGRGRGGRRAAHATPTSTPPVMATVVAAPTMAAGTSADDERAPDAQAASSPAAPLRQNAGVRGAGQR